MFDPHTAFDRKDLDPRYHDAQTKSDFAQSARSARRRERIAVQREVIANRLSKFWNIGEKIALLGLNSQRS